MHHAALLQPLEARAKGVLEQADEIGVRGARVQEERELRRQRGGEGELDGEGVQLNFFGAVVQAVVVEAEFAEGDEFGSRRGGAGGGDEGGEVGDDVFAPGVVDAVAVGDGFGGVRVTGGSVFCFAFVFALAFVVVLVVGGAEDGAAAGVDACCCEDSAGCW